MKKTIPAACFVCSLVIFVQMTACVSLPAETPTPMIQTHSETGLLSNFTRITANAKLSPLNNSEAVLDSIVISVGIDIPSCGFSGGIEISTYSEGNLVWEKTGQEKVVFVLPFPLDSKQIIVKPDSRVVVTRGNAYIQFDYGILVGTTKTYVDGTTNCVFFPDLPDSPDYQDQTNNWSRMPNLKLETYSQGNFRLDIPPAKETSAPMLVSTATATSSKDCQPTNIADLSFNPNLPVIIGTLVEIRAKADWNPCFRAMRLSIDNNIVYELGQPTFIYVWDTSGFSSGEHIVRLEVATQGDNDWLKPSVKESNYTLKEIESDNVTASPTEIIREIEDSNIGVSIEDVIGTWFMTSDWSPTPFEKTVYTYTLTFEIDRIEIITEHGEKTDGSWDLDGRNISWNSEFAGCQGIVISSTKMEGTCSNVENQSAHWTATKK